MVVTKHSVLFASPVNGYVWSSARPQGGISTKPKGTAFGLF